jgi:hypothetical protein
VNIKEVRFSVTLPRPVADETALAKLAFNLQYSLVWDLYAAKVTPVANGECTTLSVSIRNPNGREQTVEQLADTLQTRTAYFSPTSRVWDARPIITDDLDPEKRLLPRRLRMINLVRVSVESVEHADPPDLTTDPLSPWNKRRRAMLSFLAACARATRPH